MTPSNHSNDADRGCIIPIGGAEEKLNNPQILDRFVDICGGKSARIAIIPTASEMDVVQVEALSPVAIRLRRAEHGP